MMDLSSPLYCPQTKLWGGNVFSCVVHMGVLCDHYPCSNGPHCIGTPPHHHPRTHGRQVGGTHPTGMLSCFRILERIPFLTRRCRKETYSSRLGHCEDVNYSHSIIIYELSQHQTHNFHGHTSSSMLQHLQCKVNRFSKISSISFHKDFYISSSGVFGSDLWPVHIKRHHIDRFTLGLAFKE